jgi:hypothetical protein
MINRMYFGPLKQPSTTPQAPYDVIEMSEMVGHLDVSDRRPSPLVKQHSPGRVFLDPKAMKVN